MQIETDAENWASIIALMGFFGAVCLCFLFLFVASVFYTIQLVIASIIDIFKNKKEEDKDDK